MTHSESGKTMKTKYGHYLLGNSMLRTILIFVGINLLLFLNIIRFKSSIIGLVSAIFYIYISSMLCGNVFFKDKGPLGRIVFGLSVFITLLSVGGTIPLIFYKLSTQTIGLILLSISSILILLNVKQYGFRTMFAGVRAKGDVSSGQEKRQRISFLFRMERVPQALYTVLAVVCFSLLLISRSEETINIWSVVHPAFLPSVFIATFVLVTVLLSNASNRVKLFLVIVHSFLIHSVLVVVLNPGWYGDQWHELGWVRDIENFGKNVPNFFDLLELGASPQRLLYFGLRKRTHQGLVMILANMFNVDIYWSHVMLAPVLWALVPFFVYKISRILGGKRYSLVFSALFSISISSFIWWGSLTIPDTIGIVFFAFFLYLSLKYLSANETKRSLIFLIFLVGLASMLTHFKTGVFCMAVLLLAFGLRQYKTRKSEPPIPIRILPILSLGIGIFLLPFALFGLYGVYPYAEHMLVRFDIGNLLSTNTWSLIFGGYLDFSLRQLLPSLLIPFLGSIGLIYALFAQQEKYNRSICIFFLFAEVIFVVDYRLLKYGMVNVPMSPERMWIYRDLLLIPFAAIIVNYLLQKMLSFFSSRTWVTHGSNPFRFGARRFILATLICSFLISSLFVAAAENAYAHKSILQATNYEIQAIEYIHANTPETYHVMGDTTFTYLAYSVLGSYGGTGMYGSRAHYSRQLYSQMFSHPSIELLTKEMISTDSSVGYFVVSTRYARYTRTIESASEIFDTYAVFGDGKVYVFRYPPAERDVSIPIIIDADNYSRTNYPVEYQVNWAQVPFGTSGMHLDPNSVQVIDSEGTEVTNQHDGYQVWFENCSSSGYWSGGASDGDVLTFTHFFTSESPEKKKLIYTKFEKDGGDLNFDSTEYKYVEIRWKENYDNVANIRLLFRYMVGNETETELRWAWPSTTWDVWRSDFSLPNGTLYCFQVEIFDAEPRDWVGYYELYIDWVRFISDVGTVRWLYNSTANTEKQFRIAYDFLENTASGDRDGLPEKSFLDQISDSEAPPPHIRPTIPLVQLAVKTVDLLNQPISDVEIEVRELETKANTDTNGWAYVVVPAGEWTVVASKKGSVNEKRMNMTEDSGLMQRLDLVRIDHFTFNIWEFISFIFLIICGSVALLFFLTKKIIIKSMASM